MLRSVDDVLRSKPHMRDGARFTLPELNAYHEGYYAGLTVTLRVLRETIDRYQLATKTIRAGRRRKKAG